MLWGPVGRMSVGREHTRVPTGNRRVVSGPCSTISAQNSWPMTTSRSRSITKALPPRRAVATNCSACLSACRSEPQMPQASVRTNTSPGPGCGTGMSATTSRRSRMTAARTSTPQLERLDVHAGRAWGVAHVGAHAHRGGDGVALGHPGGGLRHLRVVELVEGQVLRRAERRAEAAAADHAGDLLVVRHVNGVVPLVEV